MSDPRSSDLPCGILRAVAHINRQGVIALLYMYGHLLCSERGRCFSQSDRRGVAVQSQQRHASRRADGRRVGKDASLWQRVKTEIGGIAADRNIFGRLQLSVPVMPCELAGV